MKLPILLREDLSKYSYNYPIPSVIETFKTGHKEQYECQNKTTGIIKVL